MLEIGNDEILVMNRLIHAEKVQYLVEEISLPRNVLIDIIRQLFHHRFIKAIDSKNVQRLTINVDEILQTTNTNLKQMRVRTESVCRSISISTCLGMMADRTSRR
jgi:hypothetical protein